MKVVVKVIGGRNKGVIYDLTEPPTTDAHYVLCEDDVLQFTVQTIKDRPNIHLALHDIFLYRSNVIGPTEEKPYYEYIWEPKRIGYNDFRGEALFHNFCGIAELLVVDKIETGYETFELENIQPLQHIEVLARKINATRINAMLDFLARNDGRDLAALARITRKYSGFKEGDKTLTYTLDRIEQYVKILEDILPVILRNPATKLIQVSKMQPYTQYSNITEDSINHIISFPENIHEVENEEESLFSLEDRYFTVDKVLETEIIEDSNLYENQVLHGFIEVLLLATDELITRLSEVKVKKSTVLIDGYESLFNKLNQFTARLNKPCIERAKEFNHRLRTLKKMLCIRLKVKRIHTSEPQFTQKAKQNLYYRKVFLMMIEWLRFGSPDWSLQNELNSIQDLSKLFEFYLFCVTKEHVLNCSRQFNGGLIASPIDGSDDTRFVFKINDKIRAELLYEPSIFHADADDALLPSYRNTEAWKGKERRNGSSNPPGSYGRNDKFRPRVDSQNVQKMYRIRRTPDVVLRLHSDEDESLLIMDAKYMVSQRAFHEAMHECVMKYLHGIHMHSNGQNKSIGLMIVNPDEEDVTRHYHHDEFSIFGSKVVTPAIMTASIDVGIAHKLGSTIQKNIFRFLELMAEKITSDGLGPILDAAENIYIVDVANSDKNPNARLVEVEAQEIKTEPVSKVDLSPKLNEDIHSEEKLTSDHEERIDLVEQQTHSEDIANKVDADSASKTQSPPAMQMPAATKLNLKGVSKTIRPTAPPNYEAISAVWTAELDDFGAYQSIFDSLGIEGSYNDVELSPNHDELIEKINGFYGGAVAPFYSLNKAVVYNKPYKATLSERKEFEISIKGNKLIDETATEKASIIFRRQ